MPARFKAACEKFEPGTLRVKIIDFGLSRFFPGNSKVSLQREGVGDDKISAPEVEDEDLYGTGVSTFDERVDIWGLGSSYFFLLTESLMFFTHHDSGQPEKVKKDEYSI